MTDDIGDEGADTTTNKAVEPTDSDGFFAVDRRCWPKACSIGMNAPLAYLVMARGTGRDMRSTLWSAKAIEERTSISWRNCKLAIQQLIEAGLIRQDKFGQHPSYFILPPNPVSGCEDGAPSSMTAAEAKLHTKMRQNPAGYLHIAPSKSEWTLALDIVKKGHARRRADTDGFEAIVYDAAAAAKPDWIWLPNAIVDGPSGEPAPIEFIRQSANIAVLRLFVDLYHVQLLDECGGIPWTMLRNNYNRKQIGAYGLYVVWGFQKSAPMTYASAETRFYKPFMTGESRTVIGPHGEVTNQDSGSTAFWKAFDLLRDIGLLDIVDHLVDAPTQEGAMLHPCPWDTGEPGEQAVARVAHQAAYSMLTPTQCYEADKQQVQLIPVSKHIYEVQLVGLARLRHRPKTKLTAAWQFKMNEDWIHRYEALRTAALGSPGRVDINDKSKRLQGEINGRSRGNQRTSQ